jgi:hypothetical protein
MHICDNGRADTGRRAAAAAHAGAAFAAGAGWMATLLLAGCASLVGCASPGPPLPPSLKLPEIVSASGLTAARVGGEVRLHWTTPERTTDKLLIAGPIAAEICRETVAGTGTAVAAQNPRRNAAGVPCSPVVARVQVSAGASDAVDILPAALTAEPARLLAYRVQLLNSAGRTAGPSQPVFAAAGPSPEPVQDWRGRGSKAGAVLEWRPEGGGESATLEVRGLESIELVRTTVHGPSAAGAGPERKSGLPGNAGLPGGAKEPVESRFRVSTAAGGAVDAGGTIDRSAQIGNTYRYTAQRVRSVVVGGQTLEVRSAPSQWVTVAVRDEFPPDAPSGLVAAPGLAGEGGQAAAQAQRPAIDLSWEPNAEARIAGYRVYRQDRDRDRDRDRNGDRDAGGATPDAWRRLDAELVPVAAYRDATVAAGQSYAYRVTAVNEAGIESAPSDEVVETAPNGQ